jgi:hypothetical protein
MKQVNASMENNIFDIELNVDGKAYRGWVNPSDKLSPEGKPVSFHVVLNDVSFGYLSYQHCKWHANEERPEELIQHIGGEIEKHYAHED